VHVSRGVDRLLSIAIAWTVLVLSAAPALAARVRARSAPPPPLQSAEPDSTAMDWSRVPEYRIVPGDVLTLDFGPRADLNGDILREITVRPDGRISVFPVGDVIAAGRTSRELETALVQLLAGDIRSPRVTVEVSKLAANAVHVLGDVVNPGRVSADPFITVVQAIAAAGGFRDGAAKNSVLVFSRNGSRTVRVARLRVDDMIKNGGLEGDLPLSRFDIVYVPRGFVGNVDSFSKQFLGSMFSATGVALQGWELFNLDRVFVVAGR
jgi:polysaccharide export outer membrane protein